MQSLKGKTVHQHMGPLSTATVIIILNVYDHCEILNTKLTDRHSLQCHHFELNIGMKCEAKRVPNSYCRQGESGKRNP